MRIFLLIFGFLGGLICFIFSFRHLFLNGSQEVISFYYAGTFQNLRLAAIPLSIIGMIGGLNTITNVKNAGKWMLLSSLGIFLFPYQEYRIGCILLFLAGMVCFFLTRKSIP